MSRGRKKKARTVDWNETREWWSKKSTQSTSPTFRTPGIKADLDRFLSLVDEDSSVLEVGPGIYPAITRFREQTYMDVSEAFLEKLPKDVMKIHQSADDVPWPFSRDEFELGVMIDVLSNIDPKKREKALREIVRACRRVLIGDLHMLTPSRGLRKGYNVPKHVIESYLKRNRFNVIGGKLYTAKKNPSERFDKVTQFLLYAEKEE